MSGWLVTIGLVLVIVGLFRIRRPHPGRLGRSTAAGPASHTYGLFDAKTEERPGSGGGLPAVFTQPGPPPRAHAGAGTPSPDYQTNSRSKLLSAGAGPPPPPPPLPKQSTLAVKFAMPVPQLPTWQKVLTPSPDAETCTCPADHHSP